MGRFIPNENTKVLFTLSAPGGTGLPDPATAATATTGGTLAAATYSYKITVLNTAGESLASSAVSQVVPSGTATNTVTLTMPTPPEGETGGFNIYGRTAGNWKKIGHIAHGVSTFVDTGAAVPSGNLPRTDQSAILDSPSLSRDIEPAIDLTDLTMSFNFSSTGNSVPTPSFSSLFETSIVGTSQATATADFYYDDEDGENLAWDALARGTKGYFIVRRFGGMPEVGDDCEVWPVTVLSRTVANMSNNTVVSFTVTCAVPKEPAEEAVVVA